MRFQEGENRGMLNKKDVIKKVVKILLVLILLFLIIPLDFGIRYEISKENIEKVVLYKNKYNEALHRTMGETIEIDEANQINLLLSNLSNTKSVFSLRTFVSFLDKRSVGNRTHLRITIIKKYGNGQINLFIRDNYVEVESQLGIVYRLYHDISDYDIWFD